jgi:hypothetical protein
LAFIDDGVRFDFEFWGMREIVRLAEKLRSIPLDDPSISALHSLAYWESEFVHRVLVGCPLANESAFARVQELFDRKIFVKYLFDTCLHDYEDSFDDTVGMLHSGQLRCAMLQARETVGYAMDGLLYASGSTNDKRKFRPERLEKLKKVFPHYEEYIETYWKFESGFPGERKMIKGYIEEALLFSEKLFRAVQDKVNKDDWGHLQDGSGRFSNVLS